MNRIDAKIDIDESSKKKTESCDVITDAKPENILDNTKSYSKRKLVNILDDVKLSNAQTYELVSKMKPSDFQDMSVVQKLKIATIEDKNSQLKIENEVLTQ